MKIVADENIPLIKYYFSDYGELVLKSGREITQADLIDADILLIRSVTEVNQALLKNTNIKFVGSATSGADHLDTDWLDAHHIKWHVAAGCNAVAVAEYVVCVIAALQKMNFLPGQTIRAGVVGVGKIGQRVADYFKGLGFDVVLCDPLRTDILSTPLDALTDLDVISFHTPLTKTGQYPTYHLVQKEFLQRQKKNCILLNAGRGEVFKSDSLKQSGQALFWCLDVFENEPHIDFDILQKALIATPHIAGYSLQSKYRGIEMIYRAALKENILGEKTVNIPEYPAKKMKMDFANDWRDVVLSVFDPVFATVEMKKELMENPNRFDVLRKKYLERYEFGFVALEDVNLSQADRLLLKKMGFKFG